MPKKGTTVTVDEVFEWAKTRDSISIAKIQREFRVTYVVADRLLNLVLPKIVYWKMREEILGDNK